MNIQKIVNILGYAVLVLVTLVLVVMWFRVSADYIERNAESAAVYTKCVQEAFGMSPAAYYDTHGVYPVCEEWLLSLRAALGPFNRLRNKARSAH